jgi:hypothetical protein
LAFVDATGCAGGTTVEWVDVSREPVSFEVYQAGGSMHGTKATLQVGDLLVPGRVSNFEVGRTMT